MREPGNTPLTLPGGRALGWASPLRRPALSPHFRLRLRRRVRHGPPAQRVINEPRNNAAGLIDLVAVLGPPPPGRLTVAGGAPRAQPVPHPPVRAELGLLLLLPAFPAGLHCFPRLIPQTPGRGVVAGSSKKSAGSVGLAVTWPEVAAGIVGVVEIPVSPAVMGSPRRDPANWYSCADAMAM